MSATVYIYQCYQVLQVQTLLWSTDFFMTSRNIIYIKWLRGILTLYTSKDKIHGKDYVFKSETFIHKYINIDYSSTVSHEYKLLNQARGRSVRIPREANAFDFILKLNRITCFPPPKETYLHDIANSAESGD